jgi:hypothetical protein
MIVKCIRTSVETGCYMRDCLNRLTSNYDLELGSIDWVGYQPSAKKRPSKTNGIVIWGKRKNIAPWLLAQKPREIAVVGSSLGITHLAKKKGDAFESDTHYLYVSSKEVCRRMYLNLKSFKHLTMPRDITSFTPELLADILSEAW